jgi:beta-glucosidase
MVGFMSAASQLLLLSATVAAVVQGQTFTNSTKAHSPPRYPSPWIRGSGDWQDAYAKARDFVSQLTLLEKSKGSVVCLLPSPFH